MGKINKVLWLDGDPSEVHHLRDVFKEFCGFEIDILDDLHDLTAALKNNIYDVLVSGCVFTRSKKIDKEYYEKEL